MMGVHVWGSQTSVFIIGSAWHHPRLSSFFIQGSKTTTTNLTRVSSFFYSKPNLITVPFSLMVVHLQIEKHTSNVHSVINIPFHNFSFNSTNYRPVVKDFTPKESIIDGVLLLESWHYGKRFSLDKGDWFTLRIVLNVIHVVIPYNWSDVANLNMWLV